MATIPVQQDFAGDVKLDRLKVLWKATLAVGVLITWIALNFAVIQRVNVVWVIIPFLSIVVGCLLTRRYTNIGRYQIAAWSYSLGALAAITLALLFVRDDMLNIVPFAFVLVVFVVGLLLNPGNTIVIAVLSGMATVGLPALMTGSFEFFSVYHIAAIAFTFIGALFAIQVTGDLYQITDWALSNYSRERRVAGELFDSKAELQKTLVRSQVLSEELQKSNDELDSARHAAEEAKHYRGQFLANMSHELRTPLNAVIGFSETMLKFPAMYDGVKLPTAYEADLQQIYSSGRQLLTLINDILDLAKVDAGKLEMRAEKVELKSLVNTVVSTAAGLVAQKPIKLELDLPEPMPNAYADRARVSQVLLNLYSNAAKFTDRGSIRLTVREDGDNVHFMVTDTGSGIAKHNLELIFEEFKQAETDRRDPRAGAGLGLAISRTLVTLMRGSVWAESELGVGSTFHVLLPLYRGQDAPPETDHSAEVAVAAAAAGR